MTDLPLLILLLLGHLLGDFYLQPDRWVAERNERHSQSVWLPVHALLHATLSGLLVWAYIGTSNAAAIAFLVMFLSHYIVDLIKSYQAPTLKWLVADQLLHLFWLVAIWLMVTQNGYPHLLDWLQAALNTPLLLVILAYLLAMKPASILISTLLGRWHLDFEDLPHADDASEGIRSTHTLASAGEYIGYIERGLIVTFLLTNQIAAVGFVLAAKSVFRFGDLKDRHDRKFTEYVMIGTFASMATGFVIGLLLKLGLEAL
ncbi:DUF3307 domain-containing protein [Ferrimonas balearica]|uniref:DUF3307 domain-containing protein n=1 Tax=Ferrimonas balearica TaxID=44012 RepID=UPI001C9989C1|nr:DUF3307 domain-containing protein [Ferrimonas balearica]MBY5920233.1 DUF3307 domain-containing protein [Ferrimonas balearica]MBY5997082.1 DUF3307 domain-containing protein [Ferrimonas balearica]